MPPDLAGNATQPSELPDSPIAKSHLEIRLQQTSGDERKLRELCIQLEILLDKATPNEDTALRMELQVERLKQGLGTESQNNTLQQTRDLLCQWFEQSSKGVANYSKLFDRFWQTSSNVLR